MCVRGLVNGVDRLAGDHLAEQLNVDRPIQMFHLLGGLQHSLTENFTKKTSREVARDRLLMMRLLVPSIDFQGGLRFQTPWQFSCSARDII